VFYDALLENSQTTHATMAVTTNDITRAMLQDPNDVGYIGSNAGTRSLSE